MSLVTRSASASMDRNQFKQVAAGNLYAGEDLDVAAPCYIKASDGKVYMSNGTANNEAATFAGFVARACKSGEPVSLFGDGSRFRYASGMTPGAILYIGATKGRLDTAATVGDLNGTAQAINATDIVVRRTAVSNPQTVADSSLNSAKVANVANAQVLGGIPLLYRIDIAAGALGNTDVVVTDKIRVIDAWLVLRGAGVATTTLQVKNGASAITAAMAASGSDQAVVRNTTLDDANWEIAAGGTLRITSATGASQPDATVYVVALRVA